MAAFVRVANGRLSPTGGPVAEIKEQMRGFYLIKTRGLHEPVHVVSKDPGAPLGSIEARPIGELEPP